MKRLILAVALSLLTVATYAQREKRIEASDKRKPDWIGRSDASAFSVTEVGESLAAASERCMASIRQYIVNSVAVNVSSTETMTTRQISRDNLMSVMNDYSSVLMTEAGQLPFLNGITLSNAEATYWERIYDKRTKSYRYEYSVRYPFTETTRRTLVDAFLAIDNAKVARFEQLRAELETIVDLDRIPQALNELDGLDNYFFDTTRKNDVATLRRNYLGLYDRISIEVEEQTTGRCVYSLRLAGRPVTSSVRPRLTSQSAIELVVEPYADSRYLLTYNAEYASPQDINTVEIRYPIGGGRIARTVYFEPQPFTPRK